MGADMIELLDRRMAEVVVSGSESDLIAIVDLRTPPHQSPPVWWTYWDPGSESLPDFDAEDNLPERLRRTLAGGTRMAEIKEDLIRNLCTSDWITLDYWGCMAEVFPGFDPPGSTVWEDFTAAMHDSAMQRGSSGRYILTSDNVARIIHSLRENRKDLQVMNDESLARLERWHSLCQRCSGFSVVYQIDA